MLLPVIHVMMVTGSVSSAEAKMTGMTPAMFTLMGM